MPTIKVSTFKGMIPAANDTVLPDNNAAHAENAFVYSGAIQGFHQFKDIYTLLSTTSRSVYRLPTNYLDADHLSEANWLEFEQPYTDVIKTSVVGDSYERYYWASPFNVPRYNTKARILAGNTGANAPMTLGMPAPGTVPTISTVPTTVAPLVVVRGPGTSSSTCEVRAFSSASPTYKASTTATSDGRTAVTGVSYNDATIVTRSYVLTWVSAYGEEGPPCAAVTLSGQNDALWVLSGMTAPAYPNRNITKTRIYRTITSTQGVSTYFLVDEIDATTTIYRDFKRDTDISVNQQLQSLTWSGPPSDLAGWVSMANGIIAGWRGKEVWFSEPYRPHAWPPQYALTTEYNVVGLGVYGQTLIVCTEGFPTAITGINPGSMTMAKVSTLEPCMSRGSVVSSPEGVYYVSPNGLIRAAQGQFTNVTKGFITKDKWQGLLQVATAKAVHNGTGYLAFGGVRFGCFDQNTFNTSAFEMDDYTGAYNGLFFDPNVPDATTTMKSDVPVVNLMTDPWSGETLVIRSGKVQWFDMQSLNRTAVPYIWRSKKFQGNKIDNFSAVKVYFHAPPGITWTPSGARNNTLVQTLGASQYGLLRVYADDKLVATREMRTSGEMFRLPSGYKASVLQFEIEARVHVTNVQLATSAKELINV